MTLCIELYTNLEKGDLDRISIKLLDATSIQKEASCIRNRNNSSEFLIKIVFGGSSDVIEKLAHELCHVMQFLSGFLVDVDIDSGIVSWMGEEFKMHELRHHERPWEKQAIPFGIELHSRYLSSVRRNFDRTILD